MGNYVGSYAGKISESDHFKGAIGALVGALNKPSLTEDESSEAASKMLQYLIKHPEVTRGDILSAIHGRLNSGDVKNPIPLLKVAQALKESMDADKIGIPGTSLKIGIHMPAFLSSGHVNKRQADVMKAVMKAHEKPGEESRTVASSLAEIGKFLVSYVPVGDVKKGDEFQATMRSLSDLVASGNHEQAADALGVYMASHPNVTIKDVFEGLEAHIDKAGVSDVIQSLKTAREGSSWREYFTPVFVGGKHDAKIERAMGAVQATKK